MKLDESLINSVSLSKSTVTGNKNYIGNIYTLAHFLILKTLIVVLLPNHCDTATSFKSLIINRRDGVCNSFKGKDHVDFSNKIVCLDTIYNVLWSFDSASLQVCCYNIIASEIDTKKSIHTSDQTVLTNVETITNSDENTEPSFISFAIGAILSAELSLPITTKCHVTRLQAAIHLLSCLDTLTTAHDLQISSMKEEVEDRQMVSEKQYSREDFQVVNRFESHGGGWGYSGHSIEAIRFMADTDILLGGFGLFGGRGEYTAKLKLLDIGPDGGEQEGDGDLLAETEEIPYECGPRQKYSVLFDEPIALQAHRWYVAWCRVSGPSSDCGSEGQSMVTTEDQVLFYFKSSKKSNNGTDVNAGQIPQLLYKIITPESQTTQRQADVTEPVHILSKDFSRTVTKECFQSLLALLQWSWNTFKLGVVDGPAVNYLCNSLELERLVYISCASLRLLKSYTNEVYPNQVIKKAPQESVHLAENIGDVRALLKQMLSDNVEVSVQGKKGSRVKTGKIVAYYTNLMNRILEECHNTFVACFHAFYPTTYLKWACLCDLLQEIDKV